MKFPQIKSVQNQVLAVGTATLASAAAGTSLSWISPYLPLLQSDETPITTGPLSVTDTSILVALFTLSSVFGAVLNAYISHFLGLKTTMWLNGTPIIVSWLLIIFTREVGYIYAMRILAGLAAGGLVFTIPLYTSEISDDNIRGRLSSLFTVCQYLGNLVNFITGAFLPYKTSPWIHISFPILFMGLFFFMPHTPQYLLNRNRLKEAEKSIEFYKNCSRNSEKFKREMARMKEFVEHQKLEKKLSIQDFTNSEARFGLLTGAFLMSLISFNGNMVMLNFAVNIFQDSGSSMDSKISSIIVAVIQFIGTIGALLIIDNLGRRKLLITATTISMIGTVSMGVFNILAVNGVYVEDVQWLPVISLSLVVFSSCFGITPVAMVVIVEILPSKIRYIGTMICLGLLMLFNTFILGIFPFLTEYFELYVSMWCFGTYSGLGLLFAIFIIKDTTAKNLFQS